MTPPTHFFINWLAANTANLERRDRAIVTISGIVPDLDGLGLVADLLMNNDKDYLPLYDEFHHVLAHNLAFVFLAAFFGFMLARKRWITALLVFAVLHIHLLGDIAGGGGRDGYKWPIFYLWPFLKNFQLTWSGQWTLSSWQNILISIIAISITIFLAWKRGYSPLEMISAKADKAFVETLRRRFGQNH